MDGTSSAHVRGSNPIRADPRSLDFFLVADFLCLDDVLRKGDAQMSPLRMLPYINLLF